MAKATVRKCPTLHCPLPRPSSPQCYLPNDTSLPDIMVDIASIVIAVISGVVALIAAGITTFFTWFSDERKRLSEAEKLVAKYRDPLLLASQDLQSRLYNIADLGLTTFFGHGGEREDDLLLYTAFLVGQYLSWTHVLRLKAQFLRFSTDQQNKELTKVLTGISYEFSTDKHNQEGARPLMLWRGQQMAIGELMTVKEDSELYSMGYAAFHKRYVGAGGVGTIGNRGEVTGARHAPMDGKDAGNKVEGICHVGEIKQGQQDGKNDGSGEFRRWLRSIIEDVSHISLARKERHARIPDQRLRRLQHLLLDLIHVLDDKNLRSEASFTSPCHRAAICNCTKCDGKTACPCSKKTPCPWTADISKDRRGPEHV